jgi:hypothetical protein
MRQLMRDAARLDDRGRKVVPGEPQRKPSDEGDGPSRPEVERPDTNELLKRMRRVDPRQARRYRQRSGQ